MGCCDVTVTKNAWWTFEVELFTAGFEIFHLYMIGKDSACHPFVRLAFVLFDHSALQSNTNKHLYHNLS
jgi:hypothetical protein